MAKNCSTYWQRGSVYPQQVTSISLWCKLLTCIKLLQQSYYSLLQSKQIRTPATHETQYRRVDCNLLRSSGEILQIVILRHIFSNENAECIFFCLDLNYPMIILSLFFLNIYIFFKKTTTKLYWRLPNYSQWKEEFHIYIKGERFPFHLSALRWTGLKGGVPRYLSDTPDYWLLWVGMQVPFHLINTALQFTSSVVFWSFLFLPVFSLPLCQLLLLSWHSYTPSLTSHTTSGCFVEFSV